MRLLPAALAISAAVHGVAIAWVESRPAKHQETKLVAPPTIEITEVVPPPAAEPEPMTVALLDDHTSAPGVVPRGHRRGTQTGPRNIATSSGVTAPSSSTLPTGEVTAPPHTSLMTMRGPEITNGVSTTFTSSFLANSRPLPPGEDQLAARRPDGTTELQPDGAGKKSVHQTFAVKVAPDGTVDIHDKANVQRHGFHVEFDVTDAMMRRHGIDPYASYKMKVLDETRDERVAMGAQYRTQQLAQSRQYMQKNLERLVASVTDPASLKQGLFDLWDDCAETGSDELVAGGKAARQQLIGFVRAKLPAGSPDAFSVAELDRLNRHRRSRSEFAPYE